jgi:Zn-dependent protease
MSGSDSWLLQRFLIWIPLLLSLTVHEWAHAMSAYRLGDDTASREGRLTLNPIVHIDLIGSIVLPLAGVPFGWAKPVPINPARFRQDISMSTGTITTAAAGPLSNLLIALLCTVIYAVLIRMNPELMVQQGRVVLEFLESAVGINLILALFNVLPLIPLDGSRVVEGLVPYRLRPAWERFAQFSPIVLIFVIVAPEILGFSFLQWPYTVMMGAMFALGNAIVAM